MKLVGRRPPGPGDGARTGDAERRLYDILPGIYLSIESLNGVA